MCQALQTIYNCKSKLTAHEDCVCILVGLYGEVQERNKKDTSLEVLGPDAH